MHDPAVLSPVVDLIVYGWLAIIAFAAVGIVYLARKYGPKAAASRPLRAVFTAGPKKGVEVSLPLPVIRGPFHF